MVRLLPNGARAATGHRRHSVALAWALSAPPAKRVASRWGARAVANAGVRADQRGATQGGATGSVHVFRRGGAAPRGPAAGRCGFTAHPASVVRGSSLCRARFGIAASRAAYEDWGKGMCMVARCGPRAGGAGAVDLTGCGGGGMVLATALSRALLHSTTGVPEGEIDGVWIAAPGVHIAADKVQWPSGDAETVTRTPEGLEMRQHGERYTARLTPKGLVWSDGDVWARSEWYRPPPTAPSLRTMLGAVGLALEVSDAPDGTPEEAGVPCGLPSCGVVAPFLSPALRELRIASRALAMAACAGLHTLSLDFRGRPPSCPALCRWGDCVRRLARLRSLALDNVSLEAGPAARVRLGVACTAGGLGAVAGVVAQARGAECVRLGAEEVQLRPG
eukprot:gene9935-7718_t